MWQRLSGEMREYAGCKFRLLRTQQKLVTRRQWRLGNRKCSTAGFFQRSFAEVKMRIFKANRRPDNSKLADPVQRISSTERAAPATTCDEPILANFGFADLRRFERGYVCFRDAVADAVRGSRE